MTIPVPSSLGRVAPPNTALAYSRLSPDSSSFGAGVAKGLGQLGDAINTISVGLKSNRDQESRVKANGALIAFQLDQEKVLDNLNRNKPEFSAIDEGYATQYYKGADELLKNAPDQPTREYMQNELINLYGKNQLAAQQLERARNADATDFSIKSQADTAANIVRSDPRQLDDQITKLSTAINATSGVLPYETIKERVRTYFSQILEGAVKGRIDQNPQLVLEELKLGTLKAGGTADLIYRESGGDPTSVNQFGYVGLYQFGAPRLADLGVYKPGADEPLNRWSKLSADAHGKWSGTFNIPGFPQVKTLNDFRASPDAQHAVFALHEKKMDQEIKDNGFDKYVGKQVNGVLITTQGLHNMLHLGGVGGTRDALTGKDVKDANGTSVLSYAAMGSGVVDAAGGVNALLSPNQKDALVILAEATLRQQQAASNEAENAAWTQLERSQSMNYSALQAAQARGDLTEPILAEAVNRQLISGEQYRTLRDDYRQQLSETGNPEAALQLKADILRGNASLDDVMARSDLSVKERSDLATLTATVGRRDAVMSRPDVKREQDRIDSIVGGVRGPLAVLDPQASERLSNALQEFSDLVHNSPDNAREIADNIINRSRTAPPNFTSFVQPQYWHGPTIGTKEDLRVRAIESRAAIQRDKITGVLDDVQYYRALLDLKNYVDVIEGLPPSGNVPVTTGGQ